MTRIALAPARRHGGLPRRRRRTCSRSRRTSRGEGAIGTRTSARSLHARHTSGSKPRRSRTTSCQGGVLVEGGGALVVALELRGVAAAEARRARLPAARSSAVAREHAVPQTRARASLLVPCVHSFGRTTGDVNSAVRRPDQARNPVGLVKSTPGTFNRAWRPASPRARRRVLGWLRDALRELAPLVGTHVLYSLTLTVPNRRPDPYRDLKRALTALRRCDGRRRERPNYHLVLASPEPLSRRVRVRARLLARRASKGFTQLPELFLRDPDERRWSLLDPDERRLALASTLLYPAREVLALGRDEHGPRRGQSPSFVISGRAEVGLAFERVPLHEAGRHARALPCGSAPPSEPVAGAPGAGEDAPVHEDHSTTTVCREVDNFAANSLRFRTRSLR